MERKIQGTLYWYNEHANVSTSEDRQIVGDIEEIVKGVEEAGHPDCGCCNPSFRGEGLRVDFDPVGNEIYVGTDDLKIAAQALPLIARDSRVRLWNPKWHTRLYNMLEPNSAEEASDLFNSAKKRQDAVWMQRASLYAKTGVQIDYEHNS